MDEAEPMEEQGAVADPGWEAGGGVSGGRRERAEVLALLLVLAAVGLALQYLFTGLSFAEATAAAPASTPSRWSVVLPILAQGGSPATAALVGLALALVVFVPGTPGRWGQWALSAISVVGVLVAALAVLGLEEALRDAASPYDYQGGGPDGPARLYVKLAAFGLWLPSFAIAGYSAFTAWRTLTDVAGADGRG